MNKIKKIVAKSLVLFFLTLFFFTFSLFLKIKILNAYDTNPVPNIDVECDEVVPGSWPPSHWFESEFHSLRPYQASPCNQQVENTARFCGNDLSLMDEVGGTFSLLNPNCHLIGDPEDGHYRCDFVVNKNYGDITINISDVGFPIMGNTQNVVNSQAQDDSIDDAKKVNDYVSWYLSGVIRKAEYPPQDPDNNVEDIQKIVDYSGPLNKLLPWASQVRQKAKTIERVTASEDDLNRDGTAEDKNMHNEIIGCVNYNLLRTDVGFGQITKCYPGSALNKHVRVSDLANRIPPLPEDFNNLDDYWIAYKRWKGYSCLEIFEYSMCIENPLKPNYWGNLYSYIPLSSTEDRKGQIVIENLSITPADRDVDISNISFADTTPADLFFSHMEEAKDLSEILQSTYTPKELIGSQEIDQSTITRPPSTETCSFATVRTNAGDNLFPGDIQINNLRYTASFSCDFYIFDLIISCSKTAVINLPTITKTPNANVVWTNLVAGSISPFRRIFPKVQEGAPVESIVDVPGAGSISYRSGNTTIASGNLYFPHIGAIKEYFLDAIQTALRPKGMGNNILSGSPGPSGLTEMCEKPDSPPGVIGAPWCELGLGYCSPENLGRFFSTGREARQASIICNGESGGDPTSMNCSCMTGETLDYSLGLFQINLLAHCAGDAISYTRNPISCTIHDPEKILECTEILMDADQNIQWAVGLYQQAGWDPWSVYLLTNAQGGCREQIDAQP
ncbi:hypothetical protein A2W13_01185 [Candidatus Woesebacteria bacterium RBG_16_36_11]|uniref:Uncharacterized protein n=3 Tax=Candidatus Woeseibacteriota TaxID=1752722 RepID=A0A1F7XB39_9BACT|nr:MAG: hypothetical protein A2Z67_03190 [Candidatus Woesebacteria bacterium RBG_13_36_22]OGM12240.1 MAG: hypothetical protein A2W13_01185 [Candidatus Woesebacteria bacterium RBG_16_36_11]OGM16161.1 MAG: hypothetical protein A2V55_01335 [Candidatus Woesebacteria bacterium RBG_19FT_COMBO_37_29]